MKKVRLGDICTVVSGTTPKSHVDEYWNGDKVWITPAEINEDTLVVTDSVRHISESAVKDSSLKSFPKGTVILSSRAPIGKTAIAGCEMYCNQGFKNLICSEKINNLYLLYFLRSRKDYLNSLGRGATFKEISKGIVENIKVPLPSIDTQIQIGNRIRTIEKLIGLRKKQLFLLDDLIKSRFVEMFGDPISNSKKWHLLELGAITSVGSSRRIFENEYVPEGVPFYRTKEIVELSKGQSITTELYISKKRYDEIKNKYGVPQVGDLLISAVGTLGVIWIVDGRHEFYYKDGNLIKVDASDKFDSIFMKALLENVIDEYRKRIASGTAYAALTISGLEKMKIYDIPITLQKLFSNFYCRVDKSKLSTENSRKMIQNVIKYREK